MFRGYVNVFWSSGQDRLEIKRGIRMLKKVSCHGCGECDPIIDAMEDREVLERTKLPRFIKGKLYRAELNDGELSITEIVAPKN